MSTTTKPSAVPWTSPEFAPDEPEKKTLTPYKVRIEDEVFSQGSFITDTEHRYHNFTSGIGAGKTVAGIMRVAANVQQWNPGELGMIVTPTSVGLKNTILPELSKWGFLQSWTYRGPQSREPGLHAPNGARILLESAENERKIERIRGPSPSWVWIDEPNLIPEKALDILIGRLRGGNYRNLFMTGTPKGRNYVWERFHPDSEDQMDSVNNVLGVPSYANPHLPIDYRRDILSEYEGAFYDQEVMGKFVKFEGLVYRWFDRLDHVRSFHDENGDLTLDGVDEWVYGVDFGHNNPAAIVALARRGDQWIATETLYERRLTDTDLAEKAVEMVERNGEGVMYCDPSDPGAITELEREGLSARGARNDITPGIKVVTGVGERDNLLVDESCQPLITEFNQYQYPEGDSTKDKPVDANNHALDAVRYALFTHLKGGGHSEWSGSEVGLDGVL